MLLIRSHQLLHLVPTAEREKEKGSKSEIDKN